VAVVAVTQMVLEELRVLVARAVGAQVA